MAVSLQVLLLSQTNMKFQPFFWLFVLGFTGSCIKEPANSGNSINTFNGTRVAVLCEGNYLWSNAQLDLYDPDSNSLWSNAFEEINKRPIGDVLQSGIVYGNTLWLVVNNSGILIGLDPKSLKVKHQINVGKSPRFACGFSGKLYVSDLENNAVTVVDTQTLATRTLRVLDNAMGTRSGWTEQITVYQNLIVSAVYDGYLWIYNPANDSTHVIPTSKGSQYLAVDAQQRLWVGASDADSSSLTCLNADFKVVERVVFPPKNNISRMCLSKSKDSLWLLVSGNLECCDLRDPQKKVFVPVVPYTSGYGLDVNPQNGDIYITDAYDYIRKGRVVILNAGADSIKQSFFSGIIPSGFVFLPK